MPVWRHLVAREKARIVGVCVRVLIMRTAQFVCASLRDLSIMTLRLCKFWLLEKQFRKGQSCSNKAVAWQQQGSSMTATRQQHDSNKAAAWQQQGSSMTATRQRTISAFSAFSAVICVIWCSMGRRLHMARVKQKRTNASFFGSHCFS